MTNVPSLLEHVGHQSPHLVKGQGALGRYWNQRKRPNSSVSYRLVYVLKTNWQKNNFVAIFPSVLCCEKQETIRPYLATELWRRCILFSAVVLIIVNIFVDAVIAIDMIVMIAEGTEGFGSCSSINRASQIVDKHTINVAICSTDVSASGTGGVDVAVGMIKC